MNKNNNTIKLNLDQDNGDLLLEGEYNLLAEERIRRSSEQTEFIKFVLIGIISQFAIFSFSLITNENEILEKIDKNILQNVLLLLSAGVVVLTTILFLFWLDHALTISVIDKFLKKKEKQNNMFGWYTYREIYSQKTFFSFLGTSLNLMKFKITIYELSVFLSFLIPPILFLIIAKVTTELKKYQNFLEIINFTVFSIFTLTLLFGLAMWNYSGKGIYFIETKQDEK